ncbi:MAG: nitroreductase family protein [Spirochaetales bacterium]|nr:nitroreductase family protein [Spirochaetales bacterium]
MIRQDLKIDILPAISDYMTVRNFKDEMVSDDIINSILEAGRAAPSAKNRQAWRFVFITDEIVRKRLESAAYGQEHIGSAPVIMALGTTNVDYRMPNGQLSYPIDLSFAAAFMILQAQNAGLGSCVVTTYDEAEVKEILTVPYSMRIPMLIAMGYPENEDEAPVCNRKSLSSIISKNHW